MNKDIVKEHENALVSGLMLCPDYIHEVHGIVAADDFFGEQARCVYEAMLGCLLKRQIIDQAMVIKELEQQRKLGKLDPSYLIAVFDGAYAMAAAPTHARFVHSWGVQRRLASVVKDGGDRISEAAVEEIPAEIARLQSEIHHAARADASDGGVEIRPHLLRLMLKLEEECKHPEGKLNGPPTGLHDLDRRHRGLSPKQLWVVAGRPSMGKSALAKTMALGAARSGARVAFVPLEDGRDRFLMRSVSELSDVPASAIREKNMSQNQWMQLASGMELLGSIPLYVEDPSRLTTVELETKLRIIQQKYGGLDVAFVDYLQKVRTGKPNQKRNEEVGEVASELKAIAKELNICVVAVAQLNRQADGRGSADRRPVLSDLRDSGEIEQDADVVIMLYRDEYYTRDNCTCPGVAEALTQKARDGETGRDCLRWDAECVRFQSLDRSYWPKEGAKQDEKKDRPFRGSPSGGGGNGESWGR